MDRADGGGDAPPAAVHISLLGPLMIAVDGVAAPAGGPTQRRLITALAVATLTKSALTVADLIDAVYSEDLPPRPRRSLATLVWRLRQRWGSDAIAFDGYAYQLDPDTCAIDAEEFERLVYRGRALARADDDAGAIAVLRAALSLWREPYQPDTAVAEPERVRLTELRLGAMDRLAQLLAQSGERGAAIELLEPVVDARPEWEHSQAQLIDCHVDAGAIADGLRVYDTARRALAEQGVEPGPDLQRSAARLATVTAPSAGAVRAPSSHRWVPSPRTPDSTGAPREITGRANELERALGTVTAAIADRHSTVTVLSGEPGIGKTTLAQAVLSEIARDERQPAVVTLTCDPRRTLPYAPFDALAVDASDGPLTDLLGGAATPAPDRHDGPSSASGMDDAGQIHAALLDRIRALAEPSGLILLVEDLHWASPDTVNAVTAVMAGGVDVAMAVLATTRNSAVPKDLLPHVGCHLRLRGLDVDAVSELIGAGAGAVGAQRMHRLTGGNPLYVRQMRQDEPGQWADMPEDLEAAIATHLRVLPSGVLDALEVASVAGDRVDVAVLTALTGDLRRARPVWIERLATAARLGFVSANTQSPGEYSFVHTLIREHLYRRMPAGRRALAHAEIGRALDRIALGRRCPADLLAHHYTRGWPETTTSEVVDKLRAAARAASAQLDFAQAVTHYRSALDYLAMDPDPTRDPDVASILGAAAGAAAAAGDLAAANELYESQRGFAETAGLTHARIFAALGALRTQFARRARPQVADRLAAALADATATNALHECPDLVGEALAAVQVYRPQTAGQLLSEITGSTPDLGTTLSLAVWEHRSVADQLDTARRLVGHPAAPPVATWLRLWVSEVAAGQRALDDAPPCPVPVSRADDQTQFDVNQWRIATLTATGKLQRAGRLIERALASPRHPDPAENARRMASFYGQRTMLALVQGQLPAARQSPEITNPTWGNRHPIMRYVTAYMLALGGEHGQSRELCDDLLDEVNDCDIPESDLLPRLMLLSDACLRSGHDGGLDACLDHLLPHRGEHGIFRFGQYWGGADRSIGGLQVALGDLDAGIASLRRSVHQFDAVHAMLYVPLAQRELARALDRRGGPGDRSEAQTARLRADRIDRDLGLRHRLSYPDEGAESAILPAQRATAG